jgi:hypothetical protein
MVHVPLLVEHVKSDICPFVGPSMTSISLNRWINQKVEISTGGTTGDKNAGDDPYPEFL